MSQFDEINGFESSCSAQLSGMLQMPTRIDIPAFQNNAHDLDYPDGSNNTTPLNYMRGRGTPKAVQKYNQAVSYNELQEDREIELDNRFSHLQLSSSVQDNFFEFQNSASEALEALEPAKDSVIGSLRRDSRVSDGSWEYNRTRDSDPERFDLNGGSQFNLNSNGEFSLQPERRFDNQFSQQLSSSPKNKQQQGLGMMSSNPGSYLVIAPQDSSSNQYASELDGRRNSPPSQYHQHQQQQQQGLYGAPPQGVYSSAAITPRELWNQQQQQQQQNGSRRSAPATPSVLSSYATASASASASAQPPSALNKYLQGPPQPSAYHSQAPAPAQPQGEYGPPARSPHYGDERQLLAERSPLYPEPRGMSPKYATSAGPVRAPQHQLQHQPPGYYPPQQVPGGYGAPPLQPHQQQLQGPYGHMSPHHGMAPPPHQQHQHHTAAGYYPPGGQIAPPAIQPDLIFQVQFKRTAKCYTNRSGYQINVRDFVVVEGDRGEDIGVVIEVFGMQEFMHRRMTDHRLMGMGGDKDSHTVDCILRLATMHERQQLPDKFHTEKTIIQSCNELAMYGFGLPIMVYDAEFQFDRNKLTIYYECNVRIDFRDFVRQLYSTYKARIWMKIGNMNTPLDVQPLATMALATGVQFSNGHTA